MKHLINLTPEEKIKIYFELCDLSFELFKKNFKSEKNAYMYLKKKLNEKRKLKIKNLSKMAI
ncbi:MAG: hypothetical protein ACP5OB_01230 [Candidatus Ratteibacteria bacterium]